jgi:hypothetical protein
MDITLVARHPYPDINCAVSAARMYVMSSMRGDKELEQRVMSGILLGGILCRQSYTLFWSIISV